jgi:uncharacterized protein (DUF433 family)
MRLGLFTAEQTRRLSKISDAQLRYWNKTKVFRPETIEGSFGPFRRVYSFRDVVGLRTVSILRNTYDVDLDDLREVERRLKLSSDASWSTVVFRVGEDHRIYFDDPSTGATVAISPVGQVSLFRMAAVIKSVERQLVLLNRRTKKQIGRVERKRSIMSNAPVIAGTRIPTAAIYDLHENGFSVARIIAEYPRLKKEDVEAAVTFERISLAG